MPHKRKRHLTTLLLHLSKMSPLVGLIGHRQVGKTTLLESVSSNYLSLDDEETLKFANSDPKSFLAALKHQGNAIDECQLSEKLFPALKERVRKDKRPGQFYLSGSMRFTSKKIIRESLTGRIMNLELLPLTLSELDQKELPDGVLRFLRTQRAGDFIWGSLTEKEHKRRLRLVTQYETNGGLPGVCFIRRPKLRTQKVIDQLETIFDRDLRQIHQTTLTLPELFRFVRQLALHDGRSIQHQTLRRTTGITPITQKKLLYALEATFVIRHIPLEGDYRGTAIFFEDHAEVLTLAQTQLSEEQKWQGLVYRNLREQAFYRIGENIEFFQYRTRSGVIVPFAMRTPDSTLGIIPVRGTPSRSAIAAAQSFLKKYSNSKVILVPDRNETRVIDERTLVVPATKLLFPLD